MILERWGVFGAADVLRLERRVLEGVVSDVSEEPTNLRDVWNCSPSDLNLQQYRCENVKSRSLQDSFKAIISGCVDYCQLLVT